MISQSCFRICGQILCLFYWLIKCVNELNVDSIEHTIANFDTSSVAWDLGGILSARWFILAAKVKTFVKILLKFSPLKLWHKSSFPHWFFTLKDTLVVILNQFNISRVVKHKLVIFVNIKRFLSFGCCLLQSLNLVLKISTFVLLTSIGILLQSGTSCV